MMKWIKNEKGSTLVMVLIVMFALTALGVALISMTIMSTSMKYNEERSKKAMYYAESGIDQVYALVAKEVDTALTAATKNTHAHMETFKTDVKNYVIPTFYDDDPTIPSTLSNNGYYTDGVQYYTDPDKAVASAFQDEADEKFIEAYRAYFNGTIDMTYVDGSVGTGGFTKLAFQTKVWNISDAPIPLDSVVNDLKVNEYPSPTNITVEDFAHGVSNEFRISGINSVVTYKNLTQKTVTAEFVVGDPSMSYPISVIEQNITAVDNPIWQNALVAVEDIEVRSNTVVNGDIYVYGSYLKPTTTLNKFKRRYSSNFGGLEIYDDLTVNKGDIVSASYVKTMASGATLQANQSHVYCSSFVTDAVSSSLKTDADSNVYTIDDVEINAKSSSINIQGSYYGFNPGEGINVEHDGSSCIILNETDGVSLTLAGNEPNIRKKEEYCGVIIMGTAYVKLDGTGGLVSYDDITLDAIANSDTTLGSAPAWPYQTGNSVFIKKNYPTYGIPDLNYVYQHNQYKVDESATAQDSGLPLVVGVRDKNLLGGTSPKDPMNYVGKQDFFYSNRDKRRDASPNYIHIPKTDYTAPVNHPSNRRIYSLANYYTEQSGSGIPMLNKKKTELTPTEVSGLITDIKNDYMYYLNTSTIRYATPPATPKSILSSVETKPFEGSYSKIDILNDGYVIDTTAFGYGNISEVDEGNWVLDMTKKATDVIYVTDSNTDIVIKGKNATTGDIHPYNSGTEGRMQGIIITNGDITIEGELDFAGVIMSGGTIVMKADGKTKTFTNYSENAMTPETNPVTKLLATKIVETKVGSYPMLLHMFKDYYNNMFGVSTPDTLSFSSSSAIITPSLTDSTNVSDRYADLIKMEYWNVK